MQRVIYGNPTTGDVEYSNADDEFRKAMEEYKRSSGRAFPTWREVLAVLESIGYRKVADSEELPVYKRGQRPYLDYPQRDACIRVFRTHERRVLRTKRGH